jgi:hypothetical protein
MSIEQDSKYYVRQIATILAQQRFALLFQPLFVVLAQIVACGMSQAAEPLDE